MQSPVKLNKINPLLSGSRREQKSYTDRYKQKTKPSPRLPLPSQTPPELSSRGERIIELMAVGCDPSTIRIQQQADEYQIMKNEYMETELMWSRMAAQTRNHIHELREQIKNEQKAIREMEKALTSKRTKLTTLLEKTASTTATLQATPEEDYEEAMAALQEQYDTIDAIGEREMGAAREECQQLEAEGEELDCDLGMLEAEIDRLTNFSAERYSSSLAELLEEEERLRAEIVDMEGEGEEITRGIRQQQAQRPIKEEVHRKYLQLYQKMFINKQLDKMAGLVDYKQEQMTRLQDYSKRKGIYRERRKEIEDIQGRIADLRRELSRVEEDIREVSTSLLNLHADSSPTRR